MVESQVEHVARAGHIRSAWQHSKLVTHFRLPTVVSRAPNPSVGCDGGLFANLKLSAFRAKCEEMLGSAFTDPDDDVRRAAAMCFSQF